MNGIIFSLALLLPPMLFSVITSRRIEQLLAPYIAVLVLALYGLAVFGKLQWFQWLLYAANAAGLVWLAMSIRAGEGKKLWQACRAKLLTPGLLCFSLLVAFFVYTSQFHIVNATDDIHYWAIEVRSLLSQNGLVDATKHLAPQFMTYTPGMQLYTWLGMASTGEWNEGILFLMLWIFYAAFLLPLTQRITWEKAWWIPVALLGIIGIPTIMNNYSYSMLRVDTAMGLCLGFALMQVWLATTSEKDRTFHLVSLTVTLCLLVLIKQVGILWGVMAISFLMVRTPRKQLPHKWRYVLLVSLVPVLAYISWRMFCTVRGLTGMHTNNIVANITAIADGQSMGWDTVTGLLAGLWKGFTQPTSVVESFVAYYPPLDITRAGWMLLMVLLPMLGAHAWKIDKREATRMTVWIGTCFLLFVVGAAAVIYVALFEGVSTEVWASVPFLIGRYFCPCLIGVLLLLLYIGMERAVSLSKCSVAAYLLAGILIGFSCNWVQIYHYLLPEPYEKIKYIESSEQLDDYLLSNGWIDQLEEPQNAVVLYGAGDETYPYKPPFMQYVLAPAKIVLASRDLNEQNTVDTIKSAKITHVVVMDEDNPVYAYLSPYVVDDDMYTDTIYAVVPQGDTFVLEEY